MHAPPFVLITNVITIMNQLQRYLQARMRAVGVYADPGQQVLYHCVTVVSVITLP